MQMIRIFIDYLLPIFYFKCMTKNREKLLMILNANKVPMNASLIYEDTKDSFDLATIYRGLNYLETNNYVSSFVFDCKESGVQRYFTIKEESHKHYMHCEKCHTFTAIPLCPLKNALSDIEEEYGFIVDEHYLTLRGICRHCAETTL